MARDITGNPWKFDAQGQGEGLSCVARDISDAEIDLPIYIDQLKIMTGVGGGDIKVSTDTTGNGVEIAFVDNAPTEDVLYWPVNEYVPGIFIEELISDAVVYVFHGYNEGD